MLWIGIVIDSTECGIVSYKAIIADEDTSLILELTTAINEYSLTDMSILATIGIEGGGTYRMSLVRLCPKARRTTF